LFWCKTNPYPASNTVPAAVEKVVWATKKGKPFYMKKPLVKPHRSWFSCPVPHKSKRHEHPTAKPPEAGLWFAERFIKPNSTVMDPFAGTGNLLLSAHAMGAEVWLNDAEPKWVKHLKATFID
jgi:DNA modification methylase